MDLFLTSAPIEGVETCISDSSTIVIRLCVTYNTVLRILASQRDTVAASSGK